MGPWIVQRVMRGGIVADFEEMSKGAGLCGLPERRSGERGAAMFGRTASFAHAGVRAPFFRTGL